MLIVTDESTLWICTEGRLSSSRKSEEESDVLVLDSLVAAGVQGQNAEIGHPVVHHGEQSLLHFTGILSSED